MIGARADVIDKAEDRQKFKDAMLKIGLDVPRRAASSASLAEGHSHRRDQVGLPCVTAAQLHHGRHRRRHRLQPRRVHPIAHPRPRAQPDVGEVLIEEIRHRLEGIRTRGDARRADNVVIVCSIENLDPMGVHTGDSASRSPRSRRSRTRNTSGCGTRRRHHPRDRRRDRRLEHPVRHRPRTRAG